MSSPHSPDHVFVRDHMCEEDVPELSIRDKTLGDVGIQRQWNEICERCEPHMLVSSILMDKYIALYPQPPPNFPIILYD